MKRNASISRRLPLGLLGILLSSAIFTAWADEETGSSPHSLRTIMQEMSENMQVITDAISREDWSLVASTAPLIAYHPQPPDSEKALIVQFFATAMPEFKYLDTKTHQAAIDLEIAAETLDGKAVIDQFATLQQSCLDCHRNFRKPFTAHFYSQP